MACAALSETSFEVATPTAWDAQPTYASFEALMTDKAGGSLNELFGSPCVPRTDIDSITFEVPLQKVLSLPPATPLP